MCSIVIVHLIKVLHKRLLVGLSSIEINSLMGCKVCNWLLHVVIVYYLRLTRELMIMIERSRGLLKLLGKLILRVGLPSCLILQKHLLFRPTFSSSLFFCWLTRLLNVTRRFINLVFRSKYILTSPPSCNCYHIVLASISWPIQAPFTFLI